MSNLTAEEKLMKARVSLIVNQPFFGFLALSMPFIKSESAGGMRTTAVDDKGRFYYNEEWINSLSPDEIIFEVAHEIGHLIQHVSDRFPAGGDRATWNLAADYVDDTMLIETGLEPSSVSKKMVTPEIQQMVKGKVTEEVYGILMQQDDNNKGSGQCPGGGQIAQPGDGDPGPKNDPNQHHSDNHRGCTAGSNIKNMTPDQKHELKQKIVAAAEVAKGQGNIPAMAANFLAEFTRPSVTWRDIIRNAASRTFKKRYSFRRPSRRGHSIGVRLPVSVPTGKVAIGMIDTSGSISEAYIHQFVSECVSILRMSGCKKIHIFFHDVMCYHHEEYTIDSIKNIKVTRGGTSHIHVFETALKEVEKPGMIVAFTDLMTSFPTEEPNCPVIWAHTADCGEYNVPFGKKVKVELTNQ
jgi:predicted metal-dependent peptidase